jgi:hypothetical protein
MWKQPLLCVVHIPKTAGTTIRETLGSILGYDKIYWIGHQRSVSHWENSVGKDFEDFLVVGGHVSAPEFDKIRRPKVFMAVVREPVRRAISLFDFITRGPDIEHPLRNTLGGLGLVDAMEKSDEFHNEIANFQCTMIGGAPTYSSALQSICEREWFIDCDARVEELVSRVCRKFGWPLAPAPLVHANVNQRKRYLVKYSASHIAAALKDINHEDSRLYALFDPGEELARRRGTPKKAPRHEHASPLPKRECCPAPAAIMSDAIREA